MIARGFRGRLFVTVMLTLFAAHAAEAQGLGHSDLARPGWYVGVAAGWANEPVSSGRKSSVRGVSVVPVFPGVAGMVVGGWGWMLLGQSGECTLWRKSRGTGDRRRGGTGGRFVERSEATFNVGRLFVQSRLNP